MKLKMIAWGVVLSTAAFAAHAGQDEALALAKSSGCLSCHAVDKKMVGPAWKDVADKYKGDAKAKETLLASIKSGSKGKWGNMPMPPQGKVSEADAGKLVEFIVSLGK